MNTHNLKTIARAGACAWLFVTAQTVWGADAKPEAKPAANQGAAPTATHGVIAPVVDGVMRPPTMSFEKEYEKRNRQGFAFRWTFDKEQIGEFPKDWESVQTNAGTPVKWQIVEEKDNLGKTKRAIALVESKNTGNVFNLLLAKGFVEKNVCVQVDIKSTGGKEDPGGGIVWRVKDANNYYLARWNWKEKNFRVYAVVDGKRKMLSNCKIEVDPAVWHELEIKDNGERILAELDEADCALIDDDTFTEPGRVGLYAKGDSLAAFDDVRLSILGKPKAAAPKTP